MNTRGEYKSKGMLRAIPACFHDWPYIITHRDGETRKRVEITIQVPLYRERYA